MKKLLLFLCLTALPCVAADPTPTRTMAVDVSTGKPTTPFDVSGANIQGILDAAHLPGPVRSATVFGYRDNAADALKSVDGRIDGQTVSPATRNLFSTYDTASRIFVRNPMYWAADVDTSCVSVWNSANADGTGGNRGCVTIFAVSGTTAYGLTNHHFSQPYQTGVQHVCIAMDNTPYTGTVTAAAWDGTTDVEVVTLSFSVAPAKIVPAVVLGPGIAAKILPVGTPLLATNQQKQAVVTEFVADDGASITIRPAQAANRSAWTAAAVTGDSDSPTFAILGSRAVLLTTYHSATSGPALPELAAAINATLPTGVVLNSLTLPVLGPAAARSIVSGGSGPLVALGDNNLIDSRYLPASSGGGSASGVVEQTWDGQADVFIDGDTTVFRLTGAPNGPRSVLLPDSQPDGKPIRVIIPGFSYAAGFVDFRGQGGQEVMQVTGTPLLGGIRMYTLVAGGGTWRHDANTLRAGDSAPILALQFVGTTPSLDNLKATYWYDDNDDPIGADAPGKKFVLHGNKTDEGQFAYVPLGPGEAARVNAAGTALEAFTPGSVTLVPTPLPATGTPGQVLSDGHHVYAWIDQDGGTYGWHRLDN